jgi:quinolinate synthase
MKMITIDKLYDSLRENQFEVKVSEELVQRARLPIERMLSVA